jgi:Na+-driven multidrug efflux pump
VWRSAYLNMLFLGGVSLVFMLFAPYLVGIFSSDPEIIHSGAACLRIISACYLLFAYGIVIVQAFNGAGDTWTPTWINLLSYWIVPLPLAYFLGHSLGMGPNRRVHRHADRRNHSGRHCHYGVPAREMEDEGSVKEGRVPSATASN